MNQTAIFWPMLAHVLLVYIVYGFVGKRRFGIVGSGGARVSQFKNRGDEPEASATASNNLMNQFELPVLFHVLCLALCVTNGVNYLTLILMWLFILSRYLHAWIHLSTNPVMLRSRVFTGGALILLVAWIWFALHLAGAV